jgi:cytochrome c1
MAIRAFSGKVDAGFPQKMRPDKESRARFRFNQIETRSRRTVIALTVSLAALVGPAMAQEHDDTPLPTKNKWSFAGPFGKYDRAQLQRGFKVYREVCQVCHGLKLLAFRNLADPGGPAFTTAQAAAIAAEYQVKGEPDDQGEVKDRPGRLADYFPPPFPNDNAARARYNAVPPDMSLLAKARGFERGFPYWVWDLITQYQEHGVDYITALMQGYEDKPPAGFTLPPGGFYNKYFPGHAIAMPPPLSDKRVDYTDGSPTTVEQYSKDISAFLMWAAEPHLEARKRIGFQVLIFLIVLSGLLYFTKKKVWHAVELDPDKLKPRAPTEYPRV